MSHTNNTIIYHGVGAIGYGIEVVDCLSDIYKGFLSMLSTPMKLPGAPSYTSQMTMNTSPVKIDISITREFQRHISDPTQKHGVIDQGMHRKWDSK